MILKDGELAKKIIFCVELMVEIFERKPCIISLRKNISPHQAVSHAIKLQSIF